MSSFCCECGKDVGMFNLDFECDIQCWLCTAIKVEHPQIKEMAEERDVTANQRKRFGKR